jgi:hypothetical protein
MAGKRKPTPTTERQFQAALNRLLQEAATEPIDVSGGYHVSPDAASDFEILITRVEQ